MLRYVPVILLTCMSCSAVLSGGEIAQSKPTVVRSRTSRSENPLIDDVARNDPDGHTGACCNRLEILTTGRAAGQWPGAVRFNADRPGVGTDCCQSLAWRCLYQGPCRHDRAAPRGKRGA